MFHKLHKLVFIITFFFFNSAYAAPTDCIQIAEDGQVNCIKAKSVFTLGASNPTYDTFEELVNQVVSIICSGYSSQYDCYLQLEGSPTYPPVGREKCLNSPTCNEYTYINYNSTSNKLFIITTVLNNSEPYYADKHFQRSLHAFHLRVCPLNTTAITAGGGTTPYLVYCKPPTTQYEPAHCDNGCNANSGSATITK